MNFNIEKLLERLVESNCLVIKKNASGRDEYYIPYMMNDAVECYIKLEHCVLMGELDDTAELVNAEYLFEADNKQGIIFSKRTGEFCTIWFDNYEIVRSLYNYGYLGHFWRAGNDSIRRLVYLIGTIYDKYKYLGAETCNDIEIELMKLLGVTPLRDFSPIDEDFAVFYDKEELAALELPGVEILISIADKVGASKLGKLLRDYYRDNTSIRGRKIATQITKVLSDKSNYKVIQEIEQRILEGASVYRLRTMDYEASMLAVIREKRDNIDSYIKELGYAGQYPNYSGVTVYEQQPFVVRELEYEEVEFKLFLVFRDPATGEESVKSI